MDTENFKYAINSYTEEYEMMYLRGIDETYYVYIVKEIEGRYGPQLLAVADGMSTIYALPTIKAFLQNLEVGQCYKLTYLGEITLDNGYTQHEYHITQISEEEYMKDAKKNQRNKIY